MTKVTIELPEIEGFEDTGEYRPVKTGEYYRNRFDHSKVESWTNAYGTTAPRFILRKIEPKFKPGEYVRDGNKIYQVITKEQAIADGCPHTDGLAYVRNTDGVALACYHHFLKKATPWTPAVGEEARDKLTGVLLGKVSRINPESDYAYYINNIGMWLLLSSLRPASFAPKPAEPRFEPAEAIKAMREVGSHMAHARAHLKQADDIIDAFAAKYGSKP